MNLAEKFDAVACTPTESEEAALQSQPEERGVTTKCRAEANESNCKEAPVRTLEKKFAIFGHDDKENINPHNHLRVAAGNSLRKRQTNRKPLSDITPKQKSTKPHSEFKKSTQVLDGDTDVQHPQTKKYGGNSKKPAYVWSYQHDVENAVSRGSKKNCSLTGKSTKTGKKGLASRSTTQRRTALAACR